jgi:hypothetical protein
MGPKKAMGLTQVVIIIVIIAFALAFLVFALPKIFSLLKI